MSKELKEELQKAENPTPPAKVDPIKELLTKMETAVSESLPTHVPAQQYMRTVLTAVKTNPKLMQCTPSSIAGAVMTMAQNGLTPLHGQAYMIPYNNRKTNSTECQLQIGYKGLLQLARRSGEIKSIGVDIVHENDEFEINLDHEGGRYALQPCMEGDRGKAKIYIARATFTNGGHQFEWMSRHEVEKHRDQFSKSKNYGPWKSDFNAMASKTVLKKLLKYLPMSTQDISLINRDEKVSQVEQDGEDFDLSEIIVEAESFEEAGE